MIRRRQLGQAALACALAQWQLAPAQSQASAVPRWKSQPFALGVASGLPRPDSVLLWTRLITSADGDEPVAPDAALPVTWEVFADPALRQPVRSGQTRAFGSRAFSVHVPVAGLQSGRDYWYRFQCGSAVSAVGHTRTACAPHEAATRLRLALASCQHWEQGHYAAHRDIASQDLDAVVFVGDYIYEGTSANYTIRQHGAPAPQTLAQYRQRHALYKSDPALQAAHAAHPWIMMWDDHEVVNDYADDRDQAYTDPARFLRRRAAAYQAYFEHLPVWWPPQTPRGSASVRLHDRFVWGSLAEIWTLDCRQYRSHHACADPFRGGGRMVVNCDELTQPDRSMLGQEQERWLDEGLKSSTRQWKLLAQTTQISPTGVDAGLPGVGRATYTDAWDGYPVARRRLLESVQRSGQRNVVTLGGDVHQNVAAQLRLRPNDLQSPVLASEFVTTSITSKGMAPGLLDQIRASNPDIAYARSDERGYTLIQVTPKGVQAEFRTTPHPVERDASLRVQSAWAVELNRAGVIRAG